MMGVAFFALCICAIALIHSLTGHTRERMHPDREATQQHPAREELAAQDHVAHTIDRSTQSRPMTAKEHLLFLESAKQPFPNVSFGLARAPRSMRASNPDEIERVDMHLDVHDDDSFVEADSLQDLLMCVHLCFKEAQFRPCIHWCDELYPADSTELAQQVP